MNFCWVTLSISNMEQSLKFYQEVIGLDVFMHLKENNGVEITMLGEKEKPKIELLCANHNEASDQGKGISIGFEVNSLDAAMELVQSKHIPIIRGPFSPNPHMRFFFIHDPDGFEVQLVENK